MDAGAAQRCLWRAQAVVHPSRHHHDVARVERVADAANHEHTSTRRHDVDSVSLAVVVDRPESLSDGELAEPDGA
jgi:hypothetical protein